MFSLRVIVAPTAVACERYRALLSGWYLSPHRNLSATRLSPGTRSSEDFGCLAKSQACGLARLACPRHPFWGSDSLAVHRAAPQHLSARNNHPARPGPAGRAKGPDDLYSGRARHRPRAGAGHGDVQREDDWAFLARACQAGAAAVQLGDLAHQVQAQAGAGLLLRCVRASRRGARMTGVCAPAWTKAKR